MTAFGLRSGEFHLEGLAGCAVQRAKPRSDCGAADRELPVYFAGRIPDAIASPTGSRFYTQSRSKHLFLFGVIDAALAGDYEAFHAGF